MCGRFAINDETNAIIEEVVEKHGIKALENWRAYVPAFNIAPTTQVPIIMHSKREASRVIAPARWSLVPPWSKTIDTRNTFNARDDTVAEKPTWRGPLKSSRCLIPASGYYEWTGAKPPKTPHWIYPERGLLMFAGIFSWWADPALPADDETRWHLTVAMLTMDTVPELAEIHHRNPIALPESFWWEWIDPEVVGDQAVVDAAVAAARPVMAGLQEYVTAPVRGQAPAPLA